MVDRFRFVKSKILALRGNQETHTEEHYEFQITKACITKTSRDCLISQVQHWFKVPARTFTRVVAHVPSQANGQDTEITKRKSLPPRIKNPGGQENLEAIKGSSFLFFAYLEREESAFIVNQ